MRLSVVIPGYNNPNAYWRRCVMSVLESLGSDDEVICVDDGSSEKPHVDIQDNRVRWILLEKNVGQSAARNEALAIASGEWVAFVDSDDEVEPDIYREAVMAAKQNAADIAVFGVRGIWVKDRLTRFDCPKRACLGVLTAESARQLYDQRLFEYPVNRVYRRKFLEEHQIRFPVGLCPGEDTIFNLTCAINGAKWCTVPVIGYRYYRYDGTSLSRYLPKRADALRRKAELWQMFALKAGDPLGVLKELTSFSDADWARTEWYNIWRKGCPMSLVERWKFLCAYADYFARPLWLVYVKKLCFSFARRYLYFSWVYKWHIRKLYPDMEDLRV